MATRMQQRRGTAAQWISTNSGNGPILSPGEIGFESDTNKFKIGDGTNHWVNLTYFTDAESITTALNTIIDGAPAALNTLNELAAALGDDPAFLASLATETYVDTAISNAAFDASSAAGVGLEWNASTDQFDVDDEVFTTKLYVDTLSIAHLENTTNVHGIENTANLATKTYADDSANAVVSTHTAVTTSVHGIPDTANLATKTYADDAVSTHRENSTNVHGIADTDALATKDYADTAISTHNLDTINVHGIANTENLATKSYADTAVSTHSSDTTDVHGIADTSLLATQEYADTAEADAITASEGYTDSAIGALTKSSVGLGDVDNTSDSSKPVSTATQTALDGKLDLSGGTLTGSLTLHADPSSSLHAATKQYVDNTASGVVAKPQVLGATTANIDATYSNGTAGVGATLTHNTNGAFPAEAGGATGWAVGRGILVKNQTNKAQNGRYFISNMGSASTPYVLTRCSYCDEASEIPGAYVFVQSGTNAGTGWIQVVADPATFVVGTDNIDVFQFSGSGTITAGTNISVSGNEVSVVATPSLSGVNFSDGTQTKEGVPSRTPIIQKTASYELSTLTHRDSMIEISSTSGTTLTIPADSSVDYPIGTTVDILQTNTGQVTIAGAAGVTVNGTPGLKLRTTWSSATLMKRAADSWVIYGDLTA